MKLVMVDRTDPGAVVEAEPVTVTVIDGYLTLELDDGVQLGFILDELLRAVDDERKGDSS